MSILLYFILGSLAVYGISELVTIEDGPFNVFRNLRGWTGKYPALPYPDDPYDIEKITAWQVKSTELDSLHTIWSENDAEFLCSFRGTLYGVLSCSYCMSTWVALFMVGVFILATDVSIPWPLIVRDNILLFASLLAGHRILKRFIG